MTDTINHFLLQLFPSEFWRGVFMLSVLWAPVSLVSKYYRDRKEERKLQLAFLPNKDKLHAIEERIRTVDSSDKYQMGMKSPLVCDLEYLMDLVRSMQLAEQPEEV